MAKFEFEVLAGIDYPPNKRAEAGSIVSDLPKDSIPWLLESGIIRPLDKDYKKPVVVEPVVEPIVEEPVLAVLADEPVLESKIEDVSLVDEVADEL